MPLSRRRAPRLNMDSPKNTRPMSTPYSPPTNAPFSRTSTLCACPARVQLAVGRMHFGRDPGARRVFAARRAGGHDAGEIAIESHSQSRDFAKFSRGCASI